MLTLSSWDLVRYFHNRSEMQNEWKPAAQYVLRHQQVGDEIVFYSLPHPFLYYVSRETQGHGSTFLPKTGFSLPQETIVSEVKSKN
jgi:hypothetical protein